MLRELFQSISDQAVRASAPIKDAFDPTKPYVWRDAKGEIKMFGSAVEFRAHRVETIDDIAQFYRDHSSNEASSSIFYMRDRVVLLIDDEDRRDRVTLALSLSPQLVCLDQMKGAVEQSALIRTLRTTLYGCFSPDLKLVDALRNLKWNDETSGQSDIQRGRASIGSAIRRELTGLEAMPEYIHFTVPVFASKVEHKAIIRCLFDPDEKTKRIILEPLPGEIDRALFMAEEEIGRRLALALKSGEDGSVPCFLYHGSP